MAWTSSVQGWSGRVCFLKGDLMAKRPTHYHHFCPSKLNRTVWCSWPRPTWQKGWDERCTCTKQHIKHSWCSETVIFWFKNLMLVPGFVPFGEFKPKPHFVCYFCLVRWIVISKNQTHSRSNSMCQWIDFHSLVVQILNGCFIVTKNA